MSELPTSNQVAVERDWLETVHETIGAVLARSADETNGVTDEQAFIAAAVKALRGHRWCGDQYPENGWPDINTALALYVKLGRSPVPIHDQTAPRPGERCLFYGYVGHGRRYRCRLLAGHESEHKSFGVPLKAEKPRETEVESVDVPRVSVPAEWYDLAVRSQTEHEQFREELHQARKVIGRAIYQLHNGRSTHALEILAASLEKP